MDELADIIGCKPSPLNYIFTDPKLAYALSFKPNASYVYRLSGIHQWKGARHAILNMDFRIDKPLRIRNPGVIRVDAFHNIKMSLVFTVITVVAVLFCFIFTSLL
uniref:Flavin-containing monooxygenase n=1 Tax=Panagrolaimus davidi TaxID=227884 RepID=A0A914P027_9BILA